MNNIKKIIDPQDWDIFIHIIKDTNITEIKSFKQIFIGLIFFQSENNKIINKYNMIKNIKSFILIIQDLVY